MVSTAPNRREFLAVGTVPPSMQPMIDETLSFCRAEIHSAARACLHGTNASKSSGDDLRAEKLNQLAALDAERQRLYEQWMAVVHEGQDPDGYYPGHVFE